MNVGKHALATLSVVAFAAPAFATQHAASIIVNDPVAAEREIIAADCDELVLNDGFAQRIDLTGDGRDDVVMDYSALECDGMFSAFCGSGGCSSTIYVALADGRYVRAFEGLVYGVRGIYYDGQRAIAIGMHGSACGRPGYQGCQDVRVWNGGAFAVVASDYDGVDRRWVVEGSGDGLMASINSFDGATLKLACDSGQASLHYGGNWYDPAAQSDGSSATLRFDLLTGAEEIRLPVRWSAADSAWVSTKPLAFTTPLVTGISAGDSIAVSSEDGHSTNQFPLAGSSRAIRALRDTCGNG